MALSPSGRIRINVTGARGALGIVTPSTPSAGQFLVKAAGGGARNYIGLSPVGTPADAVPLTALAAPGGSALVGYKGRSLTEKLSDFVSVKDYGAKANDFTFDNSDAIEAALSDLAGGAYEGAQGLYFPGGVYRITRTIQIGVNNGPIRFFSDTRATIFPDGPDDMWSIDVDFATGATANFVCFDMENITISDLLAPFKVKNGLRMQRNVGAKFTRCEFNNLNDAIDSFNDSNLCTFDTCQWRNNNRAWFCSDGSDRVGDGISNNTFFLNPQFRYHDGTALDTTGSDGTILYGGDFEPYNKSPVIVAQKLTIKSTRFERNVENGTPGIIVLNDNDLDIVSHADGATQVLPLFDIRGDGNKLKVSGAGGCAAIVRAGSRRNVTEINQFKTLQSPGAVIYECEDGNPSNVLKVGTSAQSNDPTVGIVEAVKDELVPENLTLWSATDCTVEPISGNGFRVSVTGSNPKITYAPPAGNYSNIYIAVNAVSSAAASQPILRISGAARLPELLLSNGWPSNHISRKMLTTFQDMVFSSPVFTIQPTTAVAGTTFDIYNLRTSQGFAPE